MSTETAPAMYDTDMNRLDETPTAEQTAAAESADGGWIWLDPDGNPVNVVDHTDDTVTVDYGPIGNFGGGVGETLPREGYRQVCVC